ncbi:ATP-binding cassette sub- B member 6, mitochondrial [Entomortierella lignicola]|nr:ATP-binding cassette sub- B member 6, mitochondrial [Entomortierella lignicola]
MANIGSFWPKGATEAEFGVSAVLLSFSVAFVIYNNRVPDQISISKDNQTLSNDYSKMEKIEDKKGDFKKDGSLELQDIMSIYHVLIRLYQVTAMTYLLDLGLIGYRVYAVNTPAPFSLITAKVIAWIAFTSNWINIRYDENSDGLRSRLAANVFGWVAFVGSSILAMSFFTDCWGLIVSGVLFENNSKTGLWRILVGTKDLSSQIQTGINGVFTTDDLKVAKTIFKNPLIFGKPSLEPKVSQSQMERLKELDEEEKAESEAFKGFWPKTKLAILLSYPWGEKRLQFLIFVKAIMMVIDRAINLLVPMQTGRILHNLTQNGNEAPRISEFDAWSIAIYVLYSYLQRSSSILSIVQRLIWEPVDEYSQTSISLRFFEHVHGLSMQFHLDRKSGELMQIMNRGVGAMQSVSTTVLFRLLPTIADVIIAIVYFWVSWGWKFGAIVTFNSTLYLITSVYTSKKRSRFYREWIEIDDGSYDKAVDSLVNFETVKYFTAESFEVERYKKGLEKSRGKSFEISIAYELLDMLESAVDSMAWFFKSLRRDFVSMEKILQLLEQEPTVKDIPSAEPLVVTDGEIVFDKVCFQYDENKKGLKNISFKAPKGKTVAIVGPTGSGKSTILRLAFRFWDPSSGRILIDGQDIAEKTQKSVREQIGVVPQDAVLFDDTISYNIQYGYVSASKEDVIKAAEAAQIHESILKFKDGYDTTVGERGAKLSGGEKQRIALARTIIKNPPIVLLDEATSALDSATESQIQSALAKMTENRTTLVIAHRLSTIMNADLILCIKDGEIVERGTHAELIQKALSNGGEGEYYKMWKIQLGESAKPRTPTITTKDTPASGELDDKESDNNSNSTTV